MMADTSTKDTTNINDFLIRGSDYLAQRPGFSLVGRDEELKDLQTILMRKSANGVILTGMSGVGMTALCLGLQAGKSDLKTPLDIVNLRFFWLDSDKLFESGNSTEIHATFDRLRAVLRADPKTVLIVENAGNFIDSARNAGSGTIINALLGDIKKGRYQCIMEAPYSDVPKVMKCDSDIQSEFTLMEVKEPRSEALRAIVKAAVPSYEKHHGINISDDVIDTVVMLSEKYKIKELPAQPSGALTLIDRAMSAYRLKVHSEPLQLQKLSEELKDVQAALDTGKLPPSLKGQSKEELESRLESIKSDMKDAQTDWDKLQQSFRVTYEQRRSAEEGIQVLEQAIQKDNKPAPAPATLTGSASDAFSGFDEIETSEVIQKRQKIALLQAEAKKVAEDFKVLEARVNKDLKLTGAHVLSSFSRISGIPVNKLTQDAREKLLYLDENLKTRVFGQDHAVEALSDAVRSSRMGLQGKNKPQAVFMFQGPSGTGKTEIAKALATALYDDESSLLRLDMSEYMEKHSVARLIGAPPGYAGYEEGGILTNEMEKNPNRIILVDEIEKAHPDIFNVFLQILDDARVTSGTGITSKFENTIIIMTTNIGAEHFLNPNLPFAEASNLAKEDLGKQFRNEFLNRFAGKENIVGFHPLGLPVLEKIAKREMQKINEVIKNDGLSVTLSEDDIASLCKDRYDPANGARAIPGYFAKAVTAKVSKYMLQNPDSKGVLTMTYDKEKGDVVLDTKDRIANDVNLSSTLAQVAKPA